jgi:hypothetical protein
MAIVQPISGSNLKIQHVNHQLYSDQPFLLQNSLPFYMAPFLPLNWQNHNSVQERSTEVRNWPVSTLGSQRKTAVDSSLGPESQQMLWNRHIIKEKIIKKPANRPTSYLTERKYYLAQPCPANLDSERKLRPRKIKKKRHQNTNNSPSIQHQ